MDTYQTFQQNPSDSVEKLLEESETFQWTKQWYPLAVVAFLDPTRPHSIQLLGKELVFWRDGGSQWRCFENFCPHRGVPFSEGRIESDGTLLCAYHGWRFNGEGKCVSIPQSLDKLTEAKHCSNPKSCAIAYPTQECQGLLWVWAESGEQALLESQLRKPRIIPELEEYSDRVQSLTPYVRDFPYGWDFFMENLSDPAHGPISHHNIVGNRYKDAKYFDMVPVKKISTQEGFSFEITPSIYPNVKRFFHDFQPPSCLKITYTYEDGSRLILAFYASPTRPGWCRHIGCQVLVKNEQKKQPRSLFLFGFPLPVWFSHIMSSLFAQQDLVFLHYQEKFLTKWEKSQWLEELYLPNPQDKMVVTFRKWLEYRAGGEIPWASGCNPELPPPERDKQKLFDLWTTHTQHCLVCQNALKNINRLTVLVYLASIVCLCLGILVDARFVAVQILTGQMRTFSSALVVPPSGLFWWAVGSAIFFALVGYMLKKFSRFFYVYEFEHSQND
ncbi:MAG: Rieske 2Fe-2S domain-containing protein [Oscillatoria sp. PMC 1051.18]|nr:Rieske 2Fe-2S domain-containing protein [Oscillatoria sp. PMC 1050.18]MEC5029610.1 Rieske 2Fe-2S domain-containing protein [Oscillatoria sp. PMC 1051.18]